MIEYLTSIFVIPCSILDIYPPLEDSFFHSFFLDLTGRLRLAAALIWNIVGTANRSPRRALAEWNIEQEISNDEVWNRFALTISD